MTKRTTEDHAAKLVFEGHEFLSSINIADMVDGLIAARGIQKAAAHASGIARIARVLKEPEVAADWDEVYRLIIARREM